MKWYKVTEYAPPATEVFLAAEFDVIHKRFDYSTIRFAENIKPDPLLRYAELTSMGDFMYWTHIDHPSALNIKPPPIGEDVRWKRAEEETELTEELEKVCKTVKTPEVNKK